MNFKQKKKNYSRARDKAVFNKKICRVCSCVYLIEV